MKMHKMFVLVLALALIAGWTAASYAADPPAKAAPSAAPAAKPAAAPGVKCEVAGKLASKMVTNKKGKQMKAFELAVAQAKDADGKALDDLKGKTLRVQGKKGLNLAAQDGKDVTIAGTVFNGKRLVADTIK